MNRPSDSLTLWPEGLGLSLLSPLGWVASDEDDGTYILRREPVGPRDAGGWDPTISIGTVAADEPLDLVWMVKGWTHALAQGLTDFALIDSSEGELRVGTAWRIIGTFRQGVFNLTVIQTFVAVGDLVLWLALITDVEGRHEAASVFENLLSSLALPSPGDAEPDAPTP